MWPPRTKSLCLAFAFCAFASLAEAAEVWVCTFPGLMSNILVMERFEVRPPEVIRQGEVRFRIVQDTSLGIVATSGSADLEGSPVVASTLVIDKRTGDFLISQMVSGWPERMNRVVHGQCLKG
jgi:hypothetical protein